MSFDLFSRTPRIYIELTGKKGTIIWDRVNHLIKIYKRNNNKWKTEKYDLKILCQCIQIKQNTFIIV